jgi:hypothetical protein
MAERKYSQQDQEKRVQDTCADLRAKGVDVRNLVPLHPGGVVEALREVTRDVSATRDQSQQQVEESRARAAESRRNLSGG